MKIKKILSLALASTMVLSMAIPAFAAGNETVISGGYDEPVIAVDVTPTAQAFINPLGLEIEVASGVKISGQQIISAPMTLKNKSGMDLQVGATMTTTVNESSDMRFVGTTTGGIGATKTAFAYLQAKQEKTLVGADSAVDATAIGTAYGNWAASAYNASTDLLVNTAMPATKNDLVILRAADMSGASGAFAAYKQGSVALVRLAGDCVAVPTSGKWNETVAASGDTPASGDGFEITVAYTFTTASVTKYDVVVDTSAVTSASASNSVTITPSDAKAAAGDTVTLKLTAINGVSTVTVTVKDKASTPVTVTTDPANGQLANINDTVSFVMPEGGATITVAP